MAALRQCHIKAEATATRILGRLLLLAA